MFALDIFKYIFFLLDFYFKDFLLFSAMVRGDGGFSFS